MRRARIWTAPEATSIWVEIVQARKHELQQTIQEDTFSFAVALAGNVTLTREQLAEWDNSARAWLRHADRVRSTEQNQVMLILSNVEGLAISPIPSTYRSVMDAWLTALQGMESLLNGTSQGISSGGLVLALSSWHLYPDMIVCIFHSWQIQTPSGADADMNFDIGFRQHVHHSKGSPFSQRDDSDPQSAK